MPELPDITVYTETLTGLVGGKALRKIRLGSPFLLRTVAPPLQDFEGKPVASVTRRGKRVVFSFPGDLHLAIHLMVLGRLHWKEAVGGKVPALPKGRGLLALDFDAGSVLLTEGGTKKRAALHAVAGADALREQFPVGLEPLEADRKAFGAALRRENHTLKRSLTDPRLLSGIGNAYSDEILHRAKLSPVLLTSRITDAEMEHLFDATRATLTEWTDRLRREAAGRMPDKVTAFRAEMAVHGRHGQPCPVCGAPVQRIRHAENETNYCATCQTGGKLLADRALSSLLRKDWPRSLEEMEKLQAKHRAIVAGGGNEDAIQSGDAADAKPS